MTRRSAAHVGARRAGAGVALVWCLGLVPLPRMAPLATASAETARLLVAARSERDGACTLLEVELARAFGEIRLLPTGDYTNLHIALGLPASAADRGTARIGVPPEAAKEVRAIELGSGDAGPELRVRLAMPMQVQAAAAPDGLSLDLRLAPVGSVECAQRSAALGPPTQKDAEADALVREAEDAIRAGELDRAAAAIDAGLERPENRSSPRMLELSGLVHERGDEDAEAQKAYEGYLLRYPSGEGALRVKQRLIALARSSSRPASRHESSRRWQTELHGASTQLYLSDTSRSDFDDALDPTLGTVTDRRVNVDEFLSAADVTLSASGPKTRIEARASAAYVAEYRPVVLVGADRQQGSYALLYDRWVSVANEHLGFTGRVGRQTRFGDGIFGRFDGAWLGWRLAPRLTLNAFTGHPVLSPRQSDVDVTRTFRGASFEYQPRAENWWASVHWIEQRADGMLDRRALGAELRTQWRRVALDTLLDYDLHFERLNAAYVDAVVGFENGSTLSMRGQWLHYPLLAVSNSILGQPVPTIDAVRENYDLDALEALALDRTLESRQVTATYTHTLGAKLTLVGDVSRAETSGSPESGGVPAFPGTGSEYYAGLQLIASGLASADDSWSFALRFASLEFSSVVALDVRVRVPLTPRLTLVPEIAYLDREQRADDGWLKALRPALRFVLDVTPSSQLEGRVGGALIDQRFDGPAVFGARQESAVIGHLGYRIVF